MSGYATGRVIHIDQHLSNMAINYRPSGFIADQIFPVVPVAKQTDAYVIYEQAELFRREDTKRSRGTEAQKIHYRVSSDKYYAENFALKADVTLEDRLNADPIFVSDFETGRVQRVQDGLMLDMELRISSLAFNTSQVGSFSAIGSAWTDQQNSNPLTDMQTAIDNVQDATGYRPTDILFGTLAWRNTRRNVNIKNAALGSPIGPRFSGAGRFPSTEEVAQLLEVDRIHVGRTYHNTAEEGIAQSLTPIWGDNVLVYYRPQAPTKEAPSFGYSFRWSVPGLPNMQVERHPFDTRRKIDELEIGYYQDEKVTATALGFLLTNVTSST